MIVTKTPKKTYPIYPRHTEGRCEYCGQQASETHPIYLHSDNVTRHKDHHTCLQIALTRANTAETLLRKHQEEQKQCVSSTTP